MSSILKALKKLEREKSGRFPESMNINSDILGTADSNRNISPLSMVLLFLIFFGGGIAVAIFFMKAPPSKNNVKSDIAANSLQSPIQPTVKPEVLPAEIEVVPALKGRHAESARKEAKKTVVKKDSIVKKNTLAVVSDVTKKTSEAAESVNKKIHTNAVPVLRVNGIAFQNSNADSMAIINGIPVSSGSIIEGVTVEEVRKDRVLFKRNLEKFEIQLGQSNR